MSEQRREDAEPEAQYRAANATCAQANGFYPVDESVWHPFFVSGALELVAGRHITAGDQGKAVVSDELASRNRLRLGDTITARRFDFVTGEQFGATLETEIVGIFSLAFHQDLSDWTSEYDILTNIVFADAGMRDWAQVQWNTHYGNAVLAAQPDREVSPATVYVRDPQQLNAIAEQLTALPDVDWSLYTLTRDDRDYRAAAGPLLAMETLATATAVVTVVGTLAALSLIWTMWIRGRRREIGILTAIGLRRRAVVGQFVLECGLLTVAAFLVASLAAGWATGPIGASVETLLAPEGGTEAFVATVDANLDLSVSRAPTRLEPLDYGLAPATSLLGFASLALTALSAVVIASMRILKLRPRDILSAR
jgi:ABC-type lipoprotein release transport system permease subunit